MRALIRLPDQMLRNLVRITLQVVVVSRYAQPLLTQPVPLRRLLTRNLKQRSRISRIARQSDRMAMKALVERIYSVSRQIPRNNVTTIRIFLDERVMLSLQGAADTAEPHRSRETINGHELQPDPLVRDEHQDIAIAQRAEHRGLDRLERAAVLKLPVNDSPTPRDGVTAVIALPAEDLNRIVNDAVLYRDADSQSLPPECGDLVEPHGLSSAGNT